MPAGGERPGLQALRSATSQEGMKPYSPWPRRQEEGETVLGRGRTASEAAPRLLPGSSDVVGCPGRGVLAVSRVVTQCPQGKTSANEGPLPEHLKLAGCLLGQVESRWPEGTLLTRPVTPVRVSRGLRTRPWGAFLTWVPELGPLGCSLSVQRNKWTSLWLFSIGSLFKYLTSPFSSCSPKWFQPRLKGGLKRPSSWAFGPGLLLGRYHWVVSSPEG